MVVERRSRRVLVATWGPPVDERSADPGPSPIARALRDAGEEVIATGTGQSAAAVVAAATDEDVECVVLEALTPIEDTHVAAVSDGLASVGLDTPVIAIVRGAATLDDHVAAINAALTPSS